MFAGGEIVTETEPVLFSGSGHRTLAAAIAKELAMPLGACATERFPDGEVAVHLYESVRNREVFVIQPTSPPVNDHLIELVAFADACRRAGANRIVAVIPYFGYARSDKRGESRDPIMSAAVADILQTAGIGHLITVDPHSPQLESCFRIPFDSVSAVPVLAQAVRSSLASDAVIAAPDVGAVRLATRYAEILERPVVVLHKRRETAKRTSVTHVVGEVSGRPVLLIDDMISTGGTIARSIEALLAAGAKLGIIVAATHGLFIGGARELIDTPAVAQFVVTDSMVMQNWEKLCIASIAPLLASAISRAGGFHERCAVDSQGFAGAT
jgi:ribose-phosphate pyrophosphokinase